MRLPLASFRSPYQQPRLLCSPTDLTATPFPRKSRHRSDVKRLPQSAFQLQSKSLTRLTTLLPFCRLWAEQRLCQNSFAGTQINVAEDFRENSKQEYLSRILKRAGPVNCCENVVIDWYSAPCESHQNRSGNKRRTPPLRSCRDERGGRKTLDRASQARGFRRYRELPTNNR